MGDELKDIRMCPSCKYKLSIFEKLTLNAAHGTLCPKCMRTVLIESTGSRILQFAFLIICTVSVIIFAPKLVDGKFDNIFWCAISVWLLGVVVLIKLKLNSSLYVVK